MKIMRLKVLSCVACLPLIVISLTSCGDENKEKSESGTDGGSASTITESKLNKLPADLKSLVSVEQLKELLEANGEIRTKVLDHKSYGNVTYRWPSDRMETIKVGGSEMKNKVDNMVRINMPTRLNLHGRPDAISAFNTQYKKITTEDMEKARKAMADVKARRDKEAGRTPSDTEKNAGKSVMSGVSGAVTKLVYEDVEGLGDAAKWEKSGKQLIILDGDKLLTIGCDISADSDVCKAGAVKLAKQIYSTL